MASVIGNPTPDPEFPANPEVTAKFPRPAAAMRFEEVFFLDLDTFLGPVRQALNLHFAGSSGMGRGRKDAEPEFPRRRRNRRSVTLFP